MTGISRRRLIAAKLALAAAWSAGLAPGRGRAEGGAHLHLGPARAFSFDALVELAKQAASEPYRPAVVPAPEQIAKIDYDQHWRIRFREEESMEPAGPDAPVQLFHPGRFFPEPVRVHLVEDGDAREVIYSRDYFDMPEDSPARDLPEDTGFAGFRVMRPGMEPDWVSFLGASYFRCDGPFRQYGLSARGLAIDTGLSKPEEFPRFSHFWIGRPEDPEDDVTAWALLDGPSVSGAYRFGLRNKGHGEGQVITIAARLFMRREVERLGIAPLTSMYWYSERDRIMADDWRPEIHDSDGLFMETGSGERIWRALDNPKVARTSSFFDRDPRGFGLIQRDRQFENYQDDGVFYDRRPSVWIEPMGDWGAGAEQLVELPAHDETFDNIVAYWTPETMPPGGAALSYDYRIHWVPEDPLPPHVARAVSTRQGEGGVPGQPIPEGIDKMVIDFEGPALEGLDAKSGVEAEIEANGGEIREPIGIRPVVGTNRWRLSFDFVQTGPEPVSLRAYLRRGDDTLTETWTTLARTDRKR